MPKECMATVNVGNARCWGCGIVIEHIVHIDDTLTFYCSACCPECNRPKGRKKKSEALPQAGREPEGNS